MNENVIRINSAKNINSVNLDIEENLVLESKQKQLIEYDVLDSLLVAQQADQERQETLKFRVYGKIDYLSILNGLKVDFKDISDFFTTVRTGNTRNLFNNYDFYLVTPFTGGTSLGSNKYVINYKILAKNSDIDLMYGGFSINIYNDKNYIFSNGIDIYTDGKVDMFNKPISKLYLYINYKQIANGLGINQSVERKDYNISSDGNNFSLVSFPYISYNVGDVIYGDLVSYIKENFIEESLNEQEYYITVPYSTGVLKFKYRPLIEYKIRDYSTIDSTGNINSPTIDENPIPSYAVQLDSNGNYLWRELLDFGFIEPDTNPSVGVDFPFINGSHYVFNNIIFSNEPDLTHANTALIFNQILFAQNQLINTVPSTDVNNLGKLC